MEGAAHPARWHGARRYSRADAALAKPEVYEYLEARSTLYAIRLPSNEVLQSEIAPLLWNAGPNQQVISGTWLKEEGHPRWLGAVPVEEVRLAHRSLELALDMDNDKSRWDELAKGRNRT